MCKEFEANRRTLTGIIHSKDEFTTEQIEEAYKEETGSFIVDGYFSIEGYVRHLADVGVLERFGDKYRLSRHPLIPA